MVHFGVRIPLLERVFGKTRYSAQSLYARARVGVADLGYSGQIGSILGMVRDILRGSIVWGYKGYLHRVWIGVQMGSILGPHMTCHL